MVAVNISYRLPRKDLGIGGSPVMIIIHHCIALQLIVLYGVLLIGILTSLGFIGTNTSRYLLITEKCKITSYFASTYEISVFTIIDLLRAIFYFIFAYDLGQGLYKTGLNSSDLLSYAIKKKLRFACFWSLAIFAIIASAGAAILGCLRDLHFVNDCTDKANLTIAVKEFLPYAHAVNKFLVFSSMSIICCYSVKIFYISKCKWEEATEKMKIMEWTPGEGDLCAIVEENRYLLHNNYIEMGKKTSHERNVLKRWFMMMFLVYIIFVLIHLVHVMKILRDSHQDSNSNSMDILSALFNIILHFSMFLYPYYVGIELNLAHQDYHKKIINTYLGVKIVLKDDDRTFKYTCLPGNDISGKQVLSSTTTINNDENAMLVQSGAESETVLNSQLKVRATLEYKKYYKEALKIQRSFVLTKVAEFDFIPSFLNFSIPLNSDGYIFAVMLTVMSILFSFLK